MLSAYLNATRRLLHDANGRAFSTVDLTAYINQGRKKLAIDTHCLRSLEDVSLTISTESFVVSALTSKAERVYDVKNLTLIIGSQRQVMAWFAWTDFNARFRPWTVNESRPTCWAFYGTSPATQKIYVQPVPDQSYTAQMDCFYIPVDLVDDSTVDELSYPFDEAVPYYAAYLAKSMEQSAGEAQGFLQSYAMTAMQAINSYTARIQSPYN